MKKLILISLVALSLGSCKKTAKEPYIKPASTDSIVTPIDTSVYVLSCYNNYSTTVTSTLSPTDLQIQSVDTTYYEVFKNDTLVLDSYKNWSYTSNPDYSIISDLNKLIDLKSGDKIRYVVIHRTPRNVSSYTFNGGFLLTYTDGSYKRLFAGQWSGYLVNQNQEYYKPNMNTFVVIWQFEIGKI